MPTFYNYTEGGQVYSFDDVFVPADAFRQGTLSGWGLNASGALGNNLSSNSVYVSTPVTTFAGGTNWKQVSCGYAFTSAIKTDGTLWTWGTNSNGQLADNTTVSRSTPVTTFAGGTNWKQVSAGGNHTAAIKTDGTLWGWGGNSQGQLGDNTIINRSTPITTFAGGTNWKQVSGGNQYTAAIKTDGTLWTWGRNDTGQLGTNTSTFAVIPATPVTTFAGGTNWKQVDCGGYVTSAIKTDGTLWTWGFNYAGNLGDNTTINRSTPVTTFAGGTNWKQVISGGTNVVAIKTDGTLWTWGRNDMGGTIGDNTTITRSTPVTTFAGGTNWKQVSCGNWFIEAIKTDGTLWTWGRNSYGQLGDNTAINRSTPVTTFAGGTNWKQVACGSRHATATTYIDDYQ